LRTARAATAPGSAHALDSSALRDPDISLWAVWEDAELLGVGALKRITQEHGEVKSMHTAEGARRRGVGTAMLRHIIAEAQRRGMARLSLETGAWDYFEPARALYRLHGFVECPPFANYKTDPNSVFMTLDLQMSGAADRRRFGGASL
jgi:putative acetyltransferase